MVSIYHRVYIPILDRVVDELLLLKVRLRFQAFFIFALLHNQGRKTLLETTYHDLANLHLIDLV